MEEHVKRLSVMNYEPFISGLTCIISCLSYEPVRGARISQEATDHFLMFTCHSNSFMLRVSVLLTHLSRFCARSDTSEDVAPAELQI